MGPMDRLNYVVCQKAFRHSKKVIKSTNATQTGWYFSLDYNLG